MTKIERVEVIPDDYHTFKHRCEDYSRQIEEMESHLHSISSEYEKLRSQGPKIITKEIVREVIPDDYEHTKEMLASYHKKAHEYKSQSREFEIYKRRCSEYEERIQEMESHLTEISTEYEKLRVQGPKIITKEVVREVAPSDYDDLKERVEHYRHKFHEYKEKCHTLEH